MAIQNRMNRRKFAKTTVLAAAATAIVPGFITKCTKAPAPMKRVFGKLGFEVTTLGLGGQASLQWTPDSVDPVKIILKAFDLGINYFDTSNLYGPSQANYGNAFQIKNLIPGSNGYDEALRHSIFLTTKTHLRYAKGDGEVKGVNNWTNGEQGTHTIDDLHRSLSLMFGDGKGNYPEGAYIDLMLIHNLNTREEVDALYEGLDNTDLNAERIGALAALRDYRDGTNLTGLNPQNEKLIRHIGFSGHFDPSVNMYMIQRDRSNLLDAMLVAINANDKLMFNMQYNVIPLAATKNMGVIAMKVFADGAMYTKPAEWSENPSHVVLTVGSGSLPSQPLIKYSLTTPGIHLAIIGIGHISNKDEECQLTSNLAAAQILPDGLTEAERTEIEKMAGKAKEGKTNYFQLAALPLTAPKEVSVVQNKETNLRNATVSWNTAYAGDAPIRSYEIWRDGTKIKEVPFTPQITLDPFTFTESLNDKTAHNYILKVADTKDKIAESLPLTLEKIE
ncbi:MAG: aldo/keto reductase [Bacteroidales bacterium]|nr:aldo/keto reductase [Bacteroidales bacterium]